MWSKIYIALLGVSTALMIFFTYYSWSWLQSIGAPAAAIEGFEYHSGLALSMLWLSTALLLIVGNIVLWTTRRAWAMWATLLYFGVFAIVRFFWLSRAFSGFNGGTDSAIASPLYGVILILLMAAIVFFDQFIVLRLHDKMFPPAPAEREPVVADAETTE